MRGVKIAPSILAADHADLRGEISRVEEAGADMIHVDVADGHFAPNISLGPDTVRAIRKVTRLPLDIHLMITNPEKFYEPFLSAGGDIITVHAEVASRSLLNSLTRELHQKEKRLGLALKPTTPVPSWLKRETNPFDVILVLSVNPGFPGQAFMPTVLPKIEKVAKLGRSEAMDVEVDGGVDQENASRIVEAGASVLVAGASIFRRGDVKSALQNIRAIVQRSTRELPV
ncbi:MAG TPA: ribulose-phosphate 3-epimerase [Candidatus Bathyarchaeia archaeon]|nr:ribulose-phosphate 3-epimerase [Candidatus Bathyarchaeia archaeon]